MQIVIITEVETAKGPMINSSKDKEKVEQLFALYGLQLPTPLKLSDSDIRISQSDADVNSNSMQKSVEDTPKLPNGLKPNDVVTVMEMTEA